MAEPSQPLRPEPSREGSAALRLSSASVPPSEPRASRGSFEGLDAHVDRPARFQMIVAGILLLVLVVVPLSLWRRPRAEAIPLVTSGVDAGALPPVTVAPPPPPVEEPRVLVGEAKTLACQDPGPKKTAPADCDHVTELERAFAHAIDENASCVPRDAGGGSVIYVADVLFKKRSVALTTPKEGRTFKNLRAIAACEKAVRAKLQAAPLDTMKHEHARYRLSLTATYPGSVKP